MTSEIVKFIRAKEFEYKKKLGAGGCGETVLLYDDIIDEYFVCKKYSPFYEESKIQLFKNFKEEIKLLHLLSHPNVVRVFNYYLYPETYSGYIVMEYITGSDISKYLKKTPESIDEIFKQVVTGFSYLEEKQILHRDIRIPNIMVNDFGQVKIIDFGFGKKITVSQDFDKSITLNWWCELPLDFDDSKYNFSTEVYFVGKLFEKIILENKIENFSHKSLLKEMIAIDPRNRLKSFSEIEKSFSNEKIMTSFTEDEIALYREFSHSLYNCISKIEDGVKYKTDTEEMERALEDLYKNVMLEEHLPNLTALTNCFIDGSYYTYTNRYIETGLLRSFLNLLKSSSQEKKNIISRNLQSKLDSIFRYPKSFTSDDIPF